MSSIRSTIIQACMSNIHKEISQLEHWLMTLPVENAPTGEPSLLAAIEKLTKHMEVQQHVMNHIVDRLDVLERDKASTMPSQDYMEDPWLDHSGTALQNEIIDVLEPVYCIRKTEVVEEVPAVEAPKPVETQHLVVETQHLVVEVPKPVVEAPKPVVEVPKPVVEVPKPVVEVPKPVETPKPTTLPIVTRPPVTLPVDAVVKPQDPPKEEEVEEEVEEEEEEEEEDEESYEMVTYQGVSYCKDSDGMVYTLNEEGEPSEIAVGIWKEKTQSIRFYRTT